MTSKPTERFSNRVADYVNYRPRYPRQVVEFMEATLGFRRTHVVADIGSGTGFLTALFLANGNRVYGVEPNREMREAGERLLAGHADFRSIGATAEATTLPDASVDFITAGQAFHWFDADLARREFRRILKPHGYVVLVWNQRQVGGDPFLVAYEDILRTYGTDYENVCHRAMAVNDDQTLRAFFAPNEMGMAIVPEQAQRFDFDGLKGRMLSSSYMPTPDDPRYEAMIAELRALFDRHEHDGRVSFRYDTMIYCGRLDKE